MKIRILIFSFLIQSTATFAQKTEEIVPSIIKKEKPTYLQFDLTIPIRLNQYAGDINPYDGSKEPWFLPDGLSTKIGFGIHKNKWAALGLNTGFEWKASQRFITTPLYASLRISPKISHEARIVFQTGYGKTYSLNQNGLVGVYKKISIGIENIDGLSLFLELNQNEFKSNKMEQFGNLSLGLSLISF